MLLDWHQVLLDWDQMLLDWDQMLLDWDQMLLDGNQMPMILLCLHMMKFNSNGCQRCIAWCALLIAHYIE